MLDDEVRDILEKLDLNLMNLKLRCKFWGKPYDFKKEREVSKLLTDLEHEKIEALHNVTVLESKLEKLEISPERIGRIKD